MQVTWTGTFPNLCHGTWIVEGHEVPEELARVHANTHGTYSEWHFENWMEVFKDYEDGLVFEIWKDQSPWADWAKKEGIDVKELYDALQKQDWRHNSCGGCI